MWFYCDSCKKYYSSYEEHKKNIACTYNKEQLKNVEWKQKVKLKTSKTLLNCLFVLFVFMACIGIILAFKLIPEKETIIKTVERIINTSIPTTPNTPESTESVNPTPSPSPTIKIKYNKDIFPDSSEKLLNSEDLAGKTKDDLFYGRNELFARHGYIFSDSRLDAYFRDMDWYIPLYTDSEYVHDSLFSDIEKENVITIKKQEAQLGVNVQFPTPTIIPEHTYTPYTYIEPKETIDITRKDYFNKVSDIVDETQSIFNKLNSPVTLNLSSLSFKMSSCYNEASMLDYPSDLNMFHEELKRGISEYVDCLKDMKNFELFGMDFYKDNAFKHAKEGDRIINSLEYYD